LEKEWEQKDGCMKEINNCKDEVRVDHRNNLWYLYCLLAEQEKNGVQQGDAIKSSNPFAKCQNVMQ